MLHPHYDIVHYRNIWDGLSIAQNKIRFGYKTLFEVNGLPSIELKYHYPGIDADLLTKIKEQEIATLHLSGCDRLPLERDARLHRLARTPIEAGYSHPERS